MAPISDTPYGDILLEVDLLPKRQSAAYGQADFMQQLYAEHGEPLMSYVLRLAAGDRRRAADIVHETLLRAWHSTAAHDAEILTAERSWVRSWLMRAAYNLTVDDHRGTAGANPAGTTCCATTATTAPNLVWDQAGSVLTALDVEHALSRLDAEHRAVLVQIYFEKRTAVETAHRLHIPVGTVTSRTHHALRLLRVMFDEKRERAG